MARQFIGLMSGTSLDGVDASLIELPTSGTPRTIGLVSAPMPAGLRARLAALAAARPSIDDPIGAVQEAALELTHVYARTVDQLLGEHDRKPIVAIGAHGQTIRHCPTRGYSIQLLDGALLAELSGIDVVCDFRAADLAAGGEGAPLVPAFHQNLFGSRAERRAVLNLGGIANLSLLAPDGTVLGMDTGPGNALLDAWHERHRGGPFDEDGAWAGSATADPSLLARLMADPYFGRTGPRSTGREYFNLEWVDAALASLGAKQPGPAEVQASLLELSVRTIAAALQSWRPDRLLICGGGVRNGALTARLAELLAPAMCESTAAFGIDPQAVEASAFAWLAARRADGLPGNLPSVTGASGPRVLGALYAPRVRAPNKAGA